MRFAALGISKGDEFVSFFVLYKEYIFLEYVIG